MGEINRIQRVTQNYEHLQGLKIIPLGIYFLALAAGWLGRPGDCTFSLPALLGVIILYKLIEKYYEHRFGRVKPLNSNPLANFVLPLVALAVLWTASYLDFILELPVNLFGLSMAAFLVFTFMIPNQRFRIHYLLMGVLIAVISLLPLAGVSTGSEIIKPPGPVFSMIIGIILVAGGILDHLILLRLLMPKEESFDGRSI